jgi:hypothetical protein
VEPLAHLPVLQEHQVPQVVLVAQLVLLDFIMAEPEELRDIRARAVAAAQAAAMEVPVRVQAVVVAAAAVLAHRQIKVFHHLLVAVAESIF